LVLTASRLDGALQSTSLLARTLRRRRSELAFSRETAARKLSVSERTWRAWETGRSPLVEHWPRIIEFLGFEPWPNPVTLAQTLKAARRRQGLTIESAAAVLGIDPNTLWWWEHDRKPHLRAHQARIAAFVGENHLEIGPSEPSNASREVFVAEPIGEAIRSRRGGLGLSQEQAAKIIGANSWTILLWEQGRYAPTPRFYPAIIRFLGREPWPTPQTTGERLQTERLRRGFTRWQAAAIMQVDEGSLAKWEDGHEPRNLLSKAKIDAFVTGAVPPRRQSRNRGARSLRKGQKT